MSQLLNGVSHIVVPVISISTILVVENLIEAVSSATAAKPWGVRDSVFLRYISQEYAVTKLNFFQGV